jgi:hypothetical protein
MIENSCFASLVVYEGDINEHFAIKSRRMLGELDPIRSKFRDGITASESAHTLIQLADIGLIHNPFEKIDENISVIYAGLKDQEHNYRLDFKYSIRLSDDIRKFISQEIRPDQPLLAGLGGSSRRTGIPSFYQTFNSFWTETKEGKFLYLRLYGARIKSISGIRFISDTEAIAEYEFDSNPNSTELYKLLAEHPEIRIPDGAKSYEVPFVYKFTTMPKKSAGNTYNTRFVLYDDGWRIAD